MPCPFCEAENDPGSDTCFSCGRSLSAATRGTILNDRYEILATLGRGGMGMVYKARDVHLDETVAVKLLRADIASSSDPARRFRNEVRLARRVRHRNVCSIYEYGQHGHLQYIVMEYLEGTDFRQVLRTSGPLTPPDACGIAIEVADALHAIHEVGIVHRDLKSANIMRDARGVVRVMDFGIAKQLEGSAESSATASGLTVGTPEYMSPEQARGKKLDARSDLYALGIVLYEFLTGNVPLRGDTPAATLLKHLSEEPSYDSARLPASLVPVLRKALSKDREERYHSSLEMRAGIREAQGALPQMVVNLPARRAVSLFRGGGAWRQALPDGGQYPSPSSAVPTIVGTNTPRATGAMRKPENASASVPFKQRISSSVGGEGKGRAPLLGGALLIGAVAIGSWFYPVARSGDPTPALSLPTPLQSERSAAPSVLARQPTVPSSTPDAPPDATTKAEAPRNVPPAPGGARRVVTSAPPPTVATALPTTASVAPVEASPAPAEASAVQPSTGLLRIGARPYADVDIDDRNVGTTPLGTLTLPTGPHTIRFSHPDFRPVVRRLTIKPGEMARVTIDWSLDGIPK